MKFQELSHYFSLIEQESSRLGMTRLLAEVLGKASPSEASIICNLSLGQLHPPYIGTQFNIADKNLIKVVAQLLHRSQQETEAAVKISGDIGLIVQEGTWVPEQELTVRQIYTALKHIEVISGTGSQEEKNNQLHELLKNVDPNSAKFIARIVLGKLRLGFSDMTIIDALSWMHAGDKSLKDVIEDAYNVCVDIGLIAQELKEKGVQALQQMHVKVGIPIRPAAAERLPTAAAIIEKIGACVAQPKLDGFRLQVHLDKTHVTPRIHFFSRHLQDMSHMFPDLTQEVAKLDVQSVICEGEAIVFDPNTGNFLPFQETVKRKRKHGIEEVMQEFPLQLFLFDILYLNGKDLMEQDHEARRAQLLSIVKNYSGDIIRIDDEIPITTAKELGHYFLHNIESGLEGLVVKRPNAEYKPGKRNFNWIKLKRQEEGHIEDTLDCVVLGYYAGEGKRASFGIGAFLVGIYNKDEDRFETIAKIGTGLKDHDWKDLKKKCDAIAIPHQPKNAYCDKSLIPDVWVDPQIICLVRADEITLSPVHGTGKTASKLGYALRFPRFMGYRPDKGPEETTTVKEVERLFNDQYARKI